MKILSALFLSLLVSVSWAEGELAKYQPGTHYIVLPQAVPTVDPTKIEVAEVFRYTCPHCMTFEPLVKAWVKTAPADVYLEKVPVAVGEVNEVHARAYYVAQTMGVLDKMSDELFLALAQRHEKLNDEAAMAKFFASKGVDPLVFSKVYNSFGLNSLMTQAVSKVRGYQIRGTPELIVNGKYRVTGSLLSTREEMFSVVNFLIEQERQQKSSAQ